jgi:hypothetical protein
MRARFHRCQRGHERAIHGLSTATHKLPLKTQFRSLCTPSPTVSLIVAARRKMTNLSFPQRKGEYPD